MARPISRERYIYTASAELNSVEESKYVNFFGIVVAWETPRKAQRGSDYLCDYVLVDPLITETNLPVLVRIFAPDVRQLPNIRNQGDIIRLHRVKVDKFSGIKLVASLGGIARYGGPLSSYCLFHVNPPPGRDPFVPYQLSSATYHWDEIAQLSVESLRNFSIGRRWMTALQASDDSVQKYSRKISSVFTSSADTMTFHDLIILVIAVERHLEEGLSVVWAWDGTDSPPFPSKFDSRVEEHRDLPEGISGPAHERTRLSLQRIDSMQRISMDLHRLLPPAALDSFPRLGTIIPIMFYVDHATVPVPGTWIKLRNCGFHMIHGQLQGYMASGSRWGPLQPNEGLHEIMHEYWMREEENLVSEFAPIALTGDVHQGGPAVGPSSISVGGDLVTSRVLGRGAEQQISTLREVAVDWLNKGRIGSCAYRCLTRVVDVRPLMQKSWSVARAGERGGEQDGGGDDGKAADAYGPPHGARRDDDDAIAATGTAVRNARGRSSFFTVTDEMIQHLCIEAHNLDAATAEAEGYDVDDEPDEWLFAVRLTLEDGSGMLDVDVFGKQAETFFWCVCPPTNFLLDDIARKRMRLALKLLTRADPGDDYDVLAKDTRYNDPRGCWLDICVVAHRTEADSQDDDSNDNVVFRLFDTELSMEMT